MKTAAVKHSARAVDDFAKLERCFSCSEAFRSADQVALVSTDAGWICDLPGTLLKYVVVELGDAEVFHKACWERLAITKAPTC